MTSPFAVIFITHDLSLLLEIADQIAIMYAGRIGAQGLEPDGTLNGNGLPTRSQQFLVVCHLYSNEGAKHNA